MKVLNNNVLLKEIKQEEKGKLITYETKQKPSLTCEILHADEDLNMVIGSKVVITSFAGHKIEIEGEELISVNYNQIITIL